MGLIDRFRNRGIKTRLLNPTDTFWDVRLGVSTIGYEPGKGKEGDEDWQVHYQPTPYRELFDLFAKASLGPDDVVYDLGSGLGRVVFAAAWMGARKAVGVEVNPVLHQRAEQMRARSRLARDRIEFRNVNARELRMDDLSLVYMFHPFGKSTLERVLDDVERARRSGGSRSLRIIYRNPIYEDVLDALPWLERVYDTRARAGAGRAWQYDSVIWRSR